MFAKLYVNSLKDALPQNCIQYNDGRIIFKQCLTSNKYYNQKHLPQWDKQGVLIIASQKCCTKTNISFQHNTDQ